MRLNQLRQAFRRLWKSRGFSACVIATLGLGIGATVAVFSIIYAVLIQPLPYVDPANLVSVYQSKNANDVATASDLSPGNFLDFRQQDRSFTGLGGYCGFPYVLTTQAGPEAMEGAAISANFFDVLGIHPAIGRNFLPAEDSYSAEHVVILSHRTWAEKFQSDPHIIGRPIPLNGESFYVVGVMPADFRFLNEGPTELWIPLQQQVRPDRMLWRDQRFLTVVGRLRPGVTINQARADMNRIAAQIHAAYPAADSGVGAVVIPLQEDLAGGQKRSLLLSLGIVV